MSDHDVPVLHELIKKIGKHDFTGTLLWYDPGETTGYSVFRRNSEQTFLCEQGQLTTWPIELSVMNFTESFRRFQLTKVGFESYHIYNWKLNQHSFQEVPTLQIIGCLKTLCIQKMLPYESQNAQTGKGFCTDDKLKYWGIYDPSQKHARDATRHACHYLLFGKA